MTEESIAALIVEKLRALKGVDLSDASDLRELDLISDIGLDSLDIVSLLLELEDALGINLPDDQLDDRRLHIVGNLIGFIYETDSSV